MKIYLTITALLWGFIAEAQDLIYKKDNGILKTVIVTIGSDEVSYRHFDNQTGPVLSIKKADIIKIRTRSGKEIIMEQGASFAFDSKNAIKVDLFSLGASKLTFAYERSIRPGRSFEGQLSFIGVGNRLAGVEKVSGLFARIGYKYIRSPSYYLGRGRQAHLLKGSYFRPEFVVGSFQETTISTYPTSVYKLYPSGGGYWTLGYKTEEETKDVTFIACMFNVGKQWVISDDVLFDYFVGMGFGNGEINNYAHLGVPPVFFSMGFKIGALF